MKELVIVLREPVSIRYLVVWRISTLNPVDERISCSDERSAVRYESLCISYCWNRRVFLCKKICFRDLRYLLERICPIYGGVSTENVVYPLLLFRQLYRLTFDTVTLTKSICRYMIAVNRRLYGILEISIVYRLRGIHRIRRLL